MPEALGRRLHGRLTPLGTGAGRRGGVRGVTPRRDSAVGLGVGLWVGLGALPYTRAFGPDMRAA